MAAPADVLEHDFLFARRKTLVRADRMLKRDLRGERLEGRREGLVGLDACDGRPDVGMVLRKMCREGCEGADGEGEAHKRERLDEDGRRR